MITKAHMDLFTKESKKGIAIEVNSWYNLDKIKFLNDNMKSILSKLGDEFDKTLALGSQIKYLSGKNNAFVRNKLRIGDGYGRFIPYQCKSYVDITRPVRHFLLRNHATDVDIVNCHPLIIGYLYQYFTGQPLAGLEYWNANRDDILKLVISKSSTGANRDDAKTLAFTFLYQGKVDYRFKELGLDKNDPDLIPIYDLVRDLTNECTKLSNTIRVAFPDMWEKLSYSHEKHQSRMNVGKFSTFIQNIERLCAMQIYDAAQELDLNVIDFCHDGLLVADSNGSDLSVDQCNQLTTLSMIKIRDNLGMDLEVKTKELDHPKADELERWFLGDNEINASKNNCLDIPDSLFCNITDFSKIISRDKNGIPTPEETLHRIKYINKYVAYISTAKCFFVLNSPVGWIPHTRSELMTAFSNYDYIINHWLLSPDKTTYVKAEWIPWTVTKPPITPDTLNTFTKLTHTYDPDFVIDMGQVQPWLDHLKLTWAENDENIYKYLICWFALIVQHPYKKTAINLVVKSVLEGAGKNIFTDFIGKFVLGMAHYASTSEIEDMVRKFNGHMERRLLTVWDEVGANGAAFKLAERIKDFTTRQTVVIEHKGINPYTSGDYNNSIFYSNNDYIIKPSDSDRRNVFIDASTSMVGDTAYFDKLLAIQNMSAGLHMFHYLCRLDISSFDVRAIPRTNWRRRLQDKCMSPEMRTLMWLKDRTAVHSQDLMDYYNSLVKDYGKYSNIRAFNNFWIKYTRWDKPKRVFAEPPAPSIVPATQKAGFKLDGTIVLDTIRKIRKDPDFTFEIDDDDYANNLPEA